MLKMSMPYGDNMVVQGGKPLTICGEADAPVTVTIQGRMAAASPVDGRWSVTLDPLDYGEGETLEVTCGDDTLTYNNVAVGEVWLAGGQSNMEFMLCCDAEWEAERTEKTPIRFFDVPEIACERALTDYDWSKYGYWRSADNEEDLKYYSATAYYFAKKVAAETGHIVGVIGCNWSGTPSVAWIDPEYLKGTPGQVWVDEYAEKSEGFSYEQMCDAYCNNRFMSDHSDLVKSVSFLYIGSSHEQQLEMMKNRPFPQPQPGQKMMPDFTHAPGRLYEHMVKRVAPYTLRGFIWYQGESDEFHPEIYDVMLAALTRCWRDLWRDDTLPLYMVQLASFGIWMVGTGNAYPTIRERQEVAAAELDNVYMASIMDAGMMWDIHPKRKRPAGERLAKLALRHTYGVNTPDAGSPGVASTELTNGAAILGMSFASGGLTGGSHLAQMLTVSIDGCAVYDFDASLERDRIVIRHPEIIPGRTVHVEYARAAYCPVDIFNVEGFSARPFAVDCK